MRRRGRPTRKDWGTHVRPIRKMQLDRTAEVAAFYENHPYPPAVDDVQAYSSAWNDARRRAESFLFWPHQPYRDDRSVLVAGCGTSQAVHYAVRWPNARVLGIDVSAKSIAFSETLRAKYGLGNLELRLLPLERVREVGSAFEHIVCTGVLHHLSDPAAALHALRDVLAPGGALHLMVYAPYGRAGIYMLQEYCRRLRIKPTNGAIDDLAATLKALPPDHPIVPLLRNSPDFATKAGLADALLHPNDRSYSVPELLECIRGAGLAFGRWVRQAPYVPSCGAIAASPHHRALAAMTPDEQYAAMELFRGTMVRHSAIAYRDGEAPKIADFNGGEWPTYVPHRLPDTVVVRDRVPRGATAVLINRSHTFTDLYLPLDPQRERIVKGIDGKRTVEQIYRSCSDRTLARDFFEQLWQWDQVVFDASA